ncbi:MAG: DUF4168 domain-containing protein [Calothrix sp. SM1_7_51]|nr:DUF4168 domain-containing protein [Calothrix sp. SM1_7_51]
MLHQAFFVAIITTAGVISSGLVSSSKAYAQAAPVQSDEIMKYARAVLEMEPARQEAFNEIKKIMGPVPPIVCSDQNSLNNLPGKVKDIAGNYCKNSQQIVEKNGLSNNRFNEITLQLQNDGGLQQKIQGTLMRLQKNP